MSSSHHQANLPRRSRGSFAGERPMIDVREDNNIRDEYFTAFVASPSRPPQQQQQPSGGAAGASSPNAATPHVASPNSDDAAAQRVLSWEGSGPSPSVGAGRRLSAEAANSNATDNSRQASDGGGGMPHARQVSSGESDASRVTGAVSSTTSWAW